MPLTVIFILVGIVACAVWLRHELRRAPLIPNEPRATLHDDRHATDSFQGAVKIERDSDWTARTEATRRLTEKLRREEEKKRPWEGRN